MRTCASWKMKQQQQLPPVVTRSVNWHVDDVFVHLNPEQQPTAGRLASRPTNRTSSRHSALHGCRRAASSGASNNGATWQGEKPAAGVHDIITGIGCPRHCVLFLKPELDIQSLKNGQVPNLIRELGLLPLHQQVLPA